MQVWPFRHGQLLDPEVGLDVKVKLVNQFLACCDCCLDKGFSIPLQRYMKDRAGIRILIDSYDIILS